MRANYLLYGLLSVILIFGAGCSKPYTITDYLLEPIQDPATCGIEYIEVAYPIESGKEMPSMGDMEKFRHYIWQELASKNIFAEVAHDYPNPKYLVIGTILDYKKGSGAVRYLVGWGVGDAKLLVKIELIDIKKNQIAFSGQFEGKVSDWGESGDKIFRQAAQNFAKELAKNALALRR